ncbi:MAG: sugar porter family MFS transporter [Bacteroidales bacterium]|nr:sugar porter family MFS transporter [Bacteroidales bacterium]MBN2763060.1 sugar porter family MFS transporter [Bacteroidales bacterium]
MTAKYNWAFLISISVVSAMGGYLFGFDFAVITGGLPFLRETFGLNAVLEGFTTGSLAIGCIAGCIVAGNIADRYGRKPGLLFAASIFCLSSLAMALAPNITSFIVARFFAGIGVGMASMLSPMYIAEISPPEVRGRLVTINQLTIVLGQVVTHFENFQLRDTGPDAWRWMFGLGMIPSLLFLTGLFFVPESPRWLLKAGREDDSRKVLGRIGNTRFVNNTIDAIRKTLPQEIKADFRLLFHKSIWPIVLIGIGLAVFQQFCGINVVFNYTTNIFRSIGASSTEQLLQAVYISLVNLVFTLIAMSLVDKWGRKPLMLIGAGGLAVLYIFIGTVLRTGSGTALSVFILSAIGIYAMSLAPLTWVLIAEIFPNRVRGTAISVAVIFLWLAYFILVFTFPIIEEYFGNAVAFWGYAVICVLGFLFIFIKLPETKGKSLETIEREFAGH